MKKVIQQIVTFIILILAGPHSLFCAQTSELLPVKPIILLDSGHTNTTPGAISVTGKYEVVYNDNLVAKLSNSLKIAGYVPILTRKPDQKISLHERADIANSHHALALFSIHHDSAQLVHLEPVTLKGVTTYRTRKPIAGFSIFVSKRNQYFAESLVVARLLGEELKKLGRKPSLHHAEPILGEGRQLLDISLGIYRHDDLAVLKNSNFPAILLEVGVIVDPADEAYVSSSEHQDSIVTAILVAIGRFAGKAALK